MRPLPPSSSSQGVNTPSASADGFSAKLSGNPLACRLKAGSRPKVRPVQHDLRGSHVAVENAAAIAAVYPLSKRLASDRAALRARLTRPARIDQFKQATGACCLVANHLGELVPRGVVYGLGEHPCRQSIDVQILHRDVREAADERTGQLVRSVPALAGRLGAMSCQPSLRLPPPLAAAPTPGQSALQPTLALGFQSGVLRRGERLAIGQRDKVGQPEADADRCENSRWRFGVSQCDLKADIPLAARSADDGGPEFRAGRQGAMPADFDLAWNADNADAPVFADCQAVANPEVGAVEAGLGAEARKAGLAAASGRSST